MLFAMQCSRQCPWSMDFRTSRMSHPTRRRYFDNSQANRGRAVSSPASYLRQLRANHAAPARYRKCNLLPSGHITSRPHLEYQLNIEWPRGRTWLSDRTQYNQATQACAQSDRCRLDLESRCDPQMACLPAREL